MVVCKVGSLITFKNDDRSSVAELIAVGTVVVLTVVNRIVDETVLTALEISVIKFGVAENCWEISFATVEVLVAMPF